MIDTAVRLAPASALSAGSLAHLVNQVYTDYYVKVHFDTRQFSRMVLEEDVDLNASLVALDGDMPIGMALLSIRDRQGWISGVGMVRAWRRRGIARRMMCQLQQTAAGADLLTLRLEVLQQNAPAIGLYQGLGFVWERDLLVLVREALAMPAPVRVSPYVQPVAVPTALASFTVFHQARSPWQRDLLSLQHRAPTLRALSYDEGDGLASYVIFHVQDSSCAILDLALAPQHRPRMNIAVALLRAVHAAYTRPESYIINFPADDPLLPAFTGVGYGCWQQQYELVWHVQRSDVNTEWVG